MTDKNGLNLGETARLFFMVVGAIEVGIGIGFCFYGMAFETVQALFGSMALVVGYATVAMAAQ